MPSEVIVISDNSDNEHPTGKYGNASEDSEILILSVSSPPPEPPASSQPCSSQREVPTSWETSDMENDNNSDIDSLDAEALVSANHRPSASTLALSASAASASGSQPHQYISDVFTSPDSRKRKTLAYSFNAADSDDSLVIEAPKKPAKREKKSEKEKAREKAEKEAHKQEKKEEAKRRKQEAAARKAEEKLSNKALRDANKMVIDKKTTLMDMRVELSSGLMSTSLYASLRNRMREFECDIRPLSEPVVCNSVTDHPTDLSRLDINLVRWRRSISATYDEQRRKWIPLAENERYTRIEGTYLIYVTGDEVLHSLSHNPTSLSITQQVGAIRAALGPKHHIHLMLCGWKNKILRKEVKDSVEKELVQLQVREGLFVEQVRDEEEAVTWIYNLSADLGIKPHKLIERSHLPFCAQATSAFKVGRSDGDTMTKMLAQLPRLTNQGAAAILKEYGTINHLMEAYEEAEREGGGSMMLADVVVPRTGAGRDAPRILNKALSERLYNIMWGNDPKALVN